ncbi:MAG: hypothetical protein DMD81_20045, partial [Candidatus Rokuibacteriota bacterium]
RLCHSPSVEARLVSMGSGATSNSYQDYEEAGCLMIVGADASANHPVIAIRFRRAMARGARIVVVNPKRIELCDQADLWIQQRPGTDVALFSAMAKVILDEGLANLEFVRERTEHFETWRESLGEFTLEHAAAITGVPAADIAQAARWYARPPFAGSCLIWGMGVTQHVNGIHNAHALLNLSLVTGQLGFPASGISPLRGQNNVQGCGDAGCIPTNLPGYGAYDAATLDRFERAWGVRPPGATGLVVTEMVEGCLTGDVRAMYVVGENPLLSEPDLHHAEKALSQVDMLIVQDLFFHETAELAHVFLPAAAFAEKEGTFTNSERRVQRVRQALDAPGDARPDWWITAELARRVARTLGLRIDDQFTYAGPAEIFPGSRGRPPVAVPDGRASGNAVPLRRLVSARQGALRPRRADGRSRRAAGSRLPVPAQHRTAALSLARRHDHAPRAGAARAGAAARDRDPPGRRAAARRRDGRAGPGRLPPRRVDGIRARHGSRQGRSHLRAVRETRGVGGELPDERRVRSVLEDPRVQGLRRADRAARRAGTAGALIA